ncbi:ORF1ab polyprotein, partial [RtEi arterivirus]
TRCLAARPLLPFHKQTEELGVLGLFYAPKEPIRWSCPRPFPTQECTPAGCCWLATIFPLARMTSGNNNFQQRLERVAAVLYHEGALTPAALHALQVHERGCAWYPIVGPVPGIAVYANRLHVSDAPFPGATHVLTNLPLPQRPLPQPFCPFERAHANVWAYGDKVIYMTEGKWSWAPKGDCKTEFDVVPPEHRRSAHYLTSSFPPHHIVSLDKYIFKSSGGYSYDVARTSGHLDGDKKQLPDGYCWAAVFASLGEEVKQREIRTATQFGYQTKHGVPGKYIQRRLQINGLRAVIDDEGPISVQAYTTKTSWIRHLDVDFTSHPDFVELCRIRIEPNTHPLDNPGEAIFRFGAYKWYGAGKRQRVKKAAKEDRTPSPVERSLSPRELAQAKLHEVIGANKAKHMNFYSPPADGSCGWHCLSAVANRMMGKEFKSTLPVVHRPSSDWATDADLVDAILIGHLPVGLNRNGACVDAKYVLTLDGSHWTVACRPGQTPKMLPEACVHGVCEHVGSQIGGNPLPVEGFNPAFNDVLQRVIYLPSVAIADALATMLVNPAEMAADGQGGRRDVTEECVDSAFPSDDSELRCDHSGDVLSLVAAFHAVPGTGSDVVEDVAEEAVSPVTAPVDLTVKSPSKRCETSTPEERGEGRRDVTGGGNPATCPVAAPVGPLSTLENEPLEDTSIQWTTSQILNRPGLAADSLFLDLVTVFEAAFAPAGASQAEVHAAIDATINGAKSYSECLQRLLPVAQGLKVTKDKVSLEAYFPKYVPVNSCRAIVPVPAVEYVKDRVLGKGKWEVVGKPVLLTLENVMNCSFPGSYETYSAICSAKQRIQNALRDKYGYGKVNPADKWYPDMPDSLVDVVLQAEDDFLKVVGAQGTLERMTWMAQTFPATEWADRYVWIADEQPVAVQQPPKKNRRAAQPAVAAEAAPPAQEVVEEVPESWEELADPVDLSSRSCGHLPPLLFGAPTVASNEQPDDQPLDLSAAGSIKFGPPPSQDEVEVCDFESVLSDPVVAQPLDLSGSSVTEFRAPVAKASSAPSTTSTVAKRPAKSAQALIDAKGPLSGHLQQIKDNVRKICIAATDPNFETHPQTQAWLDAMWNRVDLLTWKNTSKYQAAYQLAPVSSYLPKMIMETPPPYPCPIVLTPPDPPKSETESVDLTIRSRVSSKPATPTPPPQMEEVPLCEDPEDLQQSSKPPDPPGEESKAQADQPNQPKESLATKAGTWAGKMFDKMCGQVFNVTSHLPAFLAAAFHPGGGYTPADWCFAGFTLCCLLLCYSYPAFGCAPLVGVFSGSARRVRMGCFGVWLAFAVLLFKPTDDPVGSACDSDTPECRQLLLAFEQRQPWEPVRGLVVGPIGLTASILGKLLGGARSVWWILLRLCFVADVVCAGAYVIGQGRCKKCWGRCIRTAPSEVAFNVFPFTRGTRQSLVDLCDRFCKPKGMDPIQLACGWSGCWSGESPIEQPSSKPISYQALDEKKISASTVVAQPYDPNQAIKCLKVLQAGGAMVAIKVPTVTKVNTVPFLAPFLPKCPVNPDVKIVVDPDTFTTAIRCGYDVSSFVLGEGDFAAANGLKVQQMQRPSGGGYVMPAIHVAVWMAVHMLLGLWITSVDSCGVGTRDPWCSSPFSVPVFGSGTLCTSNLCISPAGLTLPLASLVKDFGAREVGIIGLVLASVACLAHKLAVKTDALLVLASILCHAHPMLAWVVCLYPLALRWCSVSPLTMLWVHFFLVVCNPAAGILSVVLVIMFWTLGRFTHVAGLITPYDIHAYTNGPRGASALVTAPEGTYLAAVRRAALTGRTVLYSPSNVGSLLEGAFRTAKPCLNTCNVVGSSMGSGGVFTYQGKKVCVTASHVLAGNSARVTGPGYNKMLEFTTKGDFAIANCEDWLGPAPAAKSVPASWTGKAFWMTSTGVEPGIVGNGFAFCFTKCGDSGSPVITESGDLVGIHTGSNKQGGGIITRPDGTTCSIEKVKLTELSKFFAGPSVPLGDVKVGDQIIVDTHDVPSDLCALLASKPGLEGGLSTVQLLCVFFLLWRMMGHVYTPVVAILFFLLNEVLPAVLVRSVFSFGMTVLAWFTPWSGQVLMIRLLTAALNRNKWSLAFYALGGLVGCLADFAVSRDLPIQVALTMSTYHFLPRLMAISSAVPLACAAAVHFVAVVLWLFKWRSLHNLLVGDGSFSSAFFLRYFAEGKLREGVSQSCGMNHESLTGALAVRLNDDDLSFLTRLTDFKCFVSASNMRNAANQYIEAAYAKALRIELSQLVQVDKMRGVLAKLEAFADTTVPSLNIGDIVVLLGHTPIGQVIEIMVGSVKHAVQILETRTIGGSRMSVARVVDPKPQLPPAPVPVNVPTACLEWDARGEAPDEAELRRKDKGRRYQKIGEHTIDGEQYAKYWDKTTGDVFYSKRDHRDDGAGYKSTVIGKGGILVKDNRTEVYEGAGPYQAPDMSKLEFVKCGTIKGQPHNWYKDPETKQIWVLPEQTQSSHLEAARLSVEQALTQMGAGTDLTAAEVEKLKRIIDQLQSMTREQCLNLLTASGLHRCGRGGLLTTPTAVKIVRYHQRTFSLGDVNLKVTSEVDARESEKYGHVVVARPTDGGAVLLRPSPPTLIDVLIGGADADQGIVPNHGPGNTGIHGELWDFESPPTKEEIELSAQIIAACDLRRGDAPSLKLPYKLHPVRGDPYREKGVLKNSRFGDVPYKTPADTGSPIHVAACYSVNTTPVSDGKSIIATTLPAGFELYVPTIPSSVLDYLDSRPDCPKHLTEHGSPQAAERDLSKYDLSTQGFVLPGVFRMVRKYLHGHIGKCPPIHRPSTYPAKNSQAGVNGARFPTKDVQGMENIDELCAQAVRECWQTVTPCTLKKQYCSKKKTRTILGTNNFIALAHRAALSGVTQGFMKKGLNSPIALGKNKFKELSTDVCGRCLEADLASCDRSTPATVRWFTANLLYELACEPEALNSYVLNCCHDVVATQTGCVSKRGGLSSGDPVTSISNTIYSLIIYAQHMVLTFLKTGHHYGLLYLQDQLKFEQLLEIQPLLVYSDDLVLHSESSSLPNYHWWVEHLDLLLGFKTDPAKTAITDAPSFLGCRIMNKRQLVPNRDRILAALAYHMKATNVSEYYASAAAILMDSCACIDYDPDWFEDLVVGIAQCAKKDGYSFPGPPFFMSMWEKLRSNYEGKAVKICGICGATAAYATSCGLDVCAYHTHFHPHCPVIIWCGHPAGSATCNDCSSPVAPGKSELDTILLRLPYKPPKTVVMKVESGLTLLDPGRYQTRRGLVAVRRGIRGNEVELQDGDYQCTPLLPTCKDINLVAVRRNVMISKFIIGPPGSGKTHWLLSQVKDGDVIYTPTHQTMLDIILALKVCRFNVPAGTILQFPAPSRTGPWVRILAGGYCPGKTSYLDEAAYCNHLDVLRVLSRTPLICLGDFKQLHPVGFDSPCYVFYDMPHVQLTSIWRFGQNICQAIQSEYHHKLESKARPTRVVFVDRPVAYGQVLTPYHKDREFGAITIDSSQGATFDVITVHLPTKDSLTRQRALVAITRARHAVYIYDPHKQLEEFFPLKELDTPCNVAFLRDNAVVVLNRHSEEISPAQALGNGDRFRVTDKRVEQALRAVCADFEGSSSPLPKVAHNLGFYFSPDLTQFAKLPRELACHWPVVTCENNEKWPDRLVASLRPIHKLSRACLGAGYQVGPSVFLGVPGTISYYLTLFLKAEAQPLPETIFSTGRIEVDCREFLDQAERDAAERYPHAFIGDTKGTTVGGCHHITSQYLPRFIPSESVATVGVSSPGKAAKSKCTLTDVYLPDLDRFLAPDTESKCYKVKVDFKDVRLMVWKDKTAYFQLEGKYFSWFELAAYSQYITLPHQAIVYCDPCMGPVEVNRPVVGSTEWCADLAITPYDYGAATILSTAGVFDIPPGFKLIGAAGFRCNDPVWDVDVKFAHLYRRVPGDWSEHNEQAFACLSNKAYNTRVCAARYNFALGPQPRALLGEVCENGSTG